MKRHRSLPLLFVFVFLAASSIITFQPVNAQSLENITINADGSISPSTAPIQQTENIYTLTRDLNGSITVNRNNSLLDGNGSTIKVSKSTGITLNHVENVTVRSFIILSSAGAQFGIDLESSSNVTVANNTISEIGNGVYSMGSPTAGIYVSGGSSNIIVGNNLSKNYDGMSFLETRNNLVVENNIIASFNPWGVSSYGIVFWGASNNIIYHNNFINNSAQAHDDSFNSPSSVNTWDNGYPSGGNFWSDYLTRYPQASMIENSGIGSTSYVIDSQNVDHYPLVEPFNETFYVLKTTPPKISLLSPLNQTYNGSTVPLVFNVDKQVNWTGYSLDNEQNATLTGNSTIAEMANGLHSVTVYANDTYGNIGASETTSFTVAKPEPSPTPSPSNSLTTTPAASQQPTQPQNSESSSALPAEYITATAAAVAVIAVAAAFALRKRGKKQ